MPQVSITGKSIKVFFDKKPEVVEGLTRIAEISHATYLALKDQHWDKMLSLIAQEGEEREKLFPGIRLRKFAVYHRAKKRRKCARIKDVWRRRRWMLHPGSQRH